MNMLLVSVLACFPYQVKVKSVIDVTKRTWSYQNTTTTKLHTKIYTRFTHSLDTCIPTCVQHYHITHLYVCWTHALHTCIMDTCTMAVSLISTS